MAIIGINALAHDSSVAYVNDSGLLVAAVEEERFNRVKKTARFPYASLRWLLDSIPEVDTATSAIAIPWSIENLSSNRQTLQGWLARMFRWSNPEARLLSSETSNMTRLEYGLMSDAALADPRAAKMVDELIGLPKIIASTNLPKAPVVAVPHRTAHAASGYYLSAFQTALVIHCDGFGDDCATSVYFGNKERLTLIKCFHFSQHQSEINSLGLFYSLITFSLGFAALQDEFKVMALGAFDSTQSSHSLLRQYVNISEEGEFTFQVSELSQALLRCNLSNLDQGPTAEPKIRLAADLQNIAQSAILKLVEYWSKKLGTRNVCLTGGVAMNCLAIGQLCSHGYNVFVPPVADDTGVSIGAAIAGGGTNEIGSVVVARHHEVKHSFFGPQFSRADCERAMARKGVSTKTLDPLHSKETSVQGSIKDAAIELARGKLVAWFSGPAEVGPRALGNRSIFANPSSSGIKTCLNAVIKEREAFRPFAAVLCEEDVEEHFEFRGAAPFMNVAVKVRGASRRLIPAAVHADGTCRIQTVSSTSNPTLHSLLTEFKSLTGIPALINTSFNRQEPMVLTPEDAINCFSKSGLDLLYLEGLKISRDQLRKIDI